MNQEEFFKTIKGNTNKITKDNKTLGANGFTRDHVQYGLDFFMNDAKTDMAYVNEFSFFCWQTIEHFGDLYRHDLHVINSLYLDKYVAHDDKSRGLLGYLYASQIEYFWIYNAYNEALYYIEKVLDYGSAFSLTYLPLILVYYYLIIIVSDDMTMLPNVILRMEDIVDKKISSKIYRFFLLLTLMEAYGRLNNKEKSNYYYKRLIEIPSEDIYVDVNYYINIRRLYLIAITNKGSQPDENYIAEYRNCMNNIQYDNECIILYYHFIDIIKYIRKAIPDEEIKRDLIKVIDSMHLVQDKIKLYQYLFDHFEINEEFALDLYEEYVTNLKTHFEMNADMQKHEIISTLNNVKELKKYRTSANVDSLTGLGNRHAYDEDVKNILEKAFIPNLHALSMDLNGLKATNDKYGHIAGDEFIRAAADCINDALADCGKVYRTGGDEFIALVYTDTSDLDKRLSRINDATSKWSQSHDRALSISIGYADKTDCEDGLEGQDLLACMSNIADERMYADKKRYYERTGIDRRRV